MELGSLRPAVASVAFLASAVATPAFAADYDGSKPLICATLQGIVCETGGQCKQGTVDSLNLPQFLWIDESAKTIAEKGPDGQIRTSPFQASTQTATHLIVQGTTDRLGWNATISKVSGKLTFVGTDGASAQIMFGACTPEK
jgi:hypothetical protein